MSILHAARDYTINYPCEKAA